MPGPQPDRLEAFEDRDVLCGVGACRVGVFAIEEKPAKPRFCGLPYSVSDRAVCGGASRGRNAPLFAQFRAGFRRSIGAAIAAAVALVLRGRPQRRRRRRRARPRRRERAGREADRRRRRAAPAISAARWPSSNAQIESVVLTCSVPSRAMRAGHAFRAIAVADRLRPARRASVGEAGLRAEARRARRGPASDEPVQGSPPRPAPARRGSALRCVAVITTCSSSATRSASTRRRRGVELREHVVEQQQRPRCSSSVSASSSARSASRCSPCEPKLRRSRSPAAIRTSSRCGPSAGRAARAGRRRAGPRVPAAVGGSALVARASPSGRPSSPARSAKPGGERRDRVAPQLRRAPPRARRRAPSTATSASRSERPSWTRRSAALRCASAAA